MDLYYSSAATAIGEYINAFKLPFNHHIPLQDHAWWSMLQHAIYTTIESYFKKHNIDISLSHLNKEWLRRRAVLRGYNTHELTDEELFIYDIVDALPYYNYRWNGNPPFEYTFPISFLL